MTVRTSLTFKSKNLSEKGFISEQRSIIHKFRIMKIPLYHRYAFLRSQQQIQQNFIKDQNSVAPDL